MQYLKKKKMFEIANKVLDLDYDVKLKECEYRFYRGMEWLRLSDDTYIYEICSMKGGNYLSVEKWLYDMELSKRVQVTFKVLNGWGKFEFPIT